MSNNISSKPLVICGSIIFFITLIISVIGWFGIPENAQIATHWNYKGEADGYVEKLEGLLLLPGISLVILLFLLALPWIEPRKANFNLSRKAYYLIAVSILALMAMIHMLSIISAMGYEINVKQMLSIIIGIFFIIIGNYLGKVRSNFFLGIRTPWTLSSENSWNRTHRLGGKLFLLLGVCVVVIALINSQFAIMILTISVITIAIFLVIYSWVVWKVSQDKIQVERSEQ